MCFLDAKKSLDIVYHLTLVKKLLDRNVPLNIVKLFFFWQRELQKRVTKTRELQKLESYKNWRVTKI